MKKKLLLAFFSLGTCSTVFSQVGINNDSPQRTLHVSGTGTAEQQNIIRIDGLNRTNNTAHENDASQKRVFATSAGDMVILNNDQTNISTEVQLPTVTVPSTANEDDAVSVITRNITLRHRSLVRIDSRVGFSVTSVFANNAAIQNGQARSYGSYYRITTNSVNPPVTSGKLGNHSAVFSTSTSSNQLTGIFYLEPKKELVLQPGTYTITLLAYVLGGNLQMTVNDAPDANQKIRVSVTPISYN